MLTASICSVLQRLLAVYTQYYTADISATNIHTEYSYVILTLTLTLPNSLHLTNALRTFHGQGSLGMVPTKRLES